MKIFEIQWSDGEKSWIAANTNIEAIQEYIRSTDTDILDEFDGSEVVEIPMEKWKEYHVFNDEERVSQQSFEEYMKTIKSPEIIAESQY